MGIISRIFSFLDEPGPDDEPGLDDFAFDHLDQKSLISVFGVENMYGVAIQGTDYVKDEDRAYELLEGKGVARLVRKPNNEASASAIEVHIDDVMVGYVPHKDTRFHSFIYLLENKGISPITRYSGNIVFLPTISVVVKTLQNDIERVFDTFDSFIDDDAFNVVFDEDVVTTQHNLAERIVRYKNKIDCYDFPVKHGRRENRKNGYGYFSVDGLVYYWSCATTLLLHAYVKLKEGNLVEKRYTAMEEQVRRDYSELGSYAAVSRKHGITTYMVKKYLSGERLYSEQGYTDEDWDVLQLSSFDVLVNHMDNLKEWNRIWKTYKSTPKTPYRPELRQEY